MVAQDTGTLDFQVYFKLYAGLLPPGGNLDLEVLDSAGNVIAHTATTRPPLHVRRSRRHGQRPHPHPGRGRTELLAARFRRQCRRHAECRRGQRLQRDDHRHAAAGAVRFGVVAERADRNHHQRRQPDTLRRRRSPSAAAGQPRRPPASPSSPAATVTASRSSPAEAATRRPRLSHSPAAALPRPLRLPQALPTSATCRPPPPTTTAGGRNSTTSLT